ncbi:hypothetical protein MKX01_042655 [Papaver californicum]|nr:hypothetical protein MKX01_042655 [Papaver californicum]
MDPNNQEVIYEFLPLLRIYKNGHVERLLESETISSCLQDPETGVSSKDIIISSDPCIYARLYIPNNHHTSSYLLYYHQYLNTLVSKANIYRFLYIYYSNISTVVVHFCKTPTSISTSNLSKESWLNDYADFNKVFLGGDSAGANIAHNIAMRAGDNGLKFRDMDSEVKAINDRLWLFVNPSSVGIDDPLINPFGSSAQSLSCLGCERVPVCVAGKDSLRERGRFYCNELKKSGWKKIEWTFSRVKEKDMLFIYISLKPRILSLLSNVWLHFSDVKQEREVTCKHSCVYSDCILDKFSKRL